MKQPAIALVVLVVFAQMSIKVCLLSEAAITLGALKRFLLVVNIADVALKI